MGIAGDIFETNMFSNKFAFTDRQLLTIEVITTFVKKCTSRCQRNEITANLFKKNVHISSLQY